MSNKIISIVTVVYNEKSIEKTIQSVIPQLSDEIEYIIIDGGSTDGTLEIIKGFESEIDILVTETDKGIYDAMNKGASLAHGEFIYHLNAGDYLLNLPLVELRNQEKEVAAVAYPIYINGDKIFKPTYNWKMKYKSAISHQGTFYKRELVHYDLAYKTFADLDLNQRIYEAKSKVIIKKGPFIANHELGGISSNKSQRKELYQVIYNNYGGFFVLVSIIESAYKKIRRTIFRKFR